MSKSVFHLCIILITVLTSCGENMLDTTTQNGYRPFSIRANEDASQSSRAISSNAKFVLYALANNSNDWTKPYINASADSAATINTDSIMIYKGLDHFGENTLNFYAATYGTATAPVVSQSEASAPPTISIGEATDTNPITTPLPDLLYAALPGQTAANSGTITLPFKHTLSRLFFQVVGQDKLTGYKITDIQIEDYERGTLDMSSGAYSRPAGDVKKYRSVLSGGSVEVTEDIRFIYTDATNTTYLNSMIFPTTGADNDSVHIKVGVERSDETTFSTTFSILLSQIVNGDVVSTPFRFVANKYYVLQLTVTDNTVSVIVTPLQKYDWIDEESELPFGTPIVFNNVQWGSRNLGATGSDMLTADGWDESMGYFYQYGRNVPYYIRPNHPDKNIKIYTYGTRTFKANLQPIPLIPEYIQKYGTEYNTNTLPDLWLHRFNVNVYSKSETNYGKVIYNLNQADDYPPDLSKPDNDPYLFVYEGNNAWNWTNDKTLFTYWQKTENQPVPPGWRIPTIEDWKAIYPNTRQAGDITNIGPTGKGVGATGDFPVQKHTEYENDISTPDGEYGISGWTGWREVIANDPENGYSTLYFCKRVPGKLYGNLYAIKYYGTDKAYRMMWKPQTINDDYVTLDNDTKNAGRNTLIIARYPCQGTDHEDDITFTDGPHKFNEEEWSLTFSSGTIYMPLVGHIYGGCLVNRGFEAAYATSSVKGSDLNIMTIRAKFNRTTNIASTGSGCFLYIRDNDYSEGKAFQIRLVRDINSSGAGMSKTPAANLATNNAITEKD